MTFSTFLLLLLCHGLCQSDPIHVPVPAPSVILVPPGRNVQISSPEVPIPGPAVPIPAISIFPEDWTGEYALTENCLDHCGGCATYISLSDRTDDGSYALYVEVTENINEIPHTIDVMKIAISQDGIIHSSRGRGWEISRHDDIYLDFLIFHDLWDVAELCNSTLTLLETQTSKPKPTKVPAFGPGAPPTPIPGAAKTEYPTIAPTFPPTEQPSEQPTETPTEAPTEAPTEPPVYLGCGCGDNPCFVGGRIYWSHEGVSGLLTVLFQSSWIPEGPLSGTPPQQVVMECTGEFVFRGIETIVYHGTRTVTISSFSVTGQGLFVRDMFIDSVLTPIGVLTEKWGQGHLDRISVGTLVECSLSGESRFSPLDNGGICAPYNLSMIVDLRATNEGPKPRGTEELSGRIDKLYADGFVISSVCEDAVIDLEVIDDGEAQQNVDFYFTKDPSKNGLTDLPNIDGIYPDITETGFFTWGLGSVHIPEEGISGHFAVNLVAAENDDQNELALAGTMNIDFLVVVNSRKPTCQITTKTLFVMVGETAYGVLTVTDEGDFADILLTRESVIFASNPSLPILDVQLSFELEFEHTCEEAGEVIFEVRVQDSCGHNGQCRGSYYCCPLSTGSISGTVFGDSNQDSKLDSAEFGFEDVTLNLFIDTDGDCVLSQDDQSFDRSMTNQDGFYEFSELPLQQYILVVTDTEDILNDFDLLRDGCVLGKTILMECIDIGETGNSYVNFAHVEQSI